MRLGESISSAGTERSAGSLSRSAHQREEAEAEAVAARARGPLHRTPPIRSRGAPAPVSGSAPGPGRPLPPRSRAYFEPIFGRDLGHVRLHDGAEASAVADSVGAAALTHGSRILLGSAAPSPDAPSRTLAHELTHVVQQTGAGAGPGSSRSGPGPRVRAEQVSTPRPASIAWARAPGGGAVLALVTEETTLPAVALAIYGGPDASSLARVNEMPATGTVSPGARLRLTGETLAPAALASLRRAIDRGEVLPSFVTDRDAHLARKRALDAELDEDERFIVGKLDELHYSDSDEQAVIARLQRWAGETFRTRETATAASEYLDELFLRLNRRTKTIGLIVSQQTSYYSLIFNHFDRVAEVRAIRDANSRIFRGDNGTQEVTYWGEVRSHVRDLGSFGSALLSSLRRAPSHLPGILGEVWGHIRAHWVPFVSVFAGFITAELVVAALTAAPDPSMATKVVAFVLQALILLILGAFAALEVVAAVRHAADWLSLAWRARGDDATIDGASRALCRTILHVALAILLFLGIRAKAPGVAASYRGIRPPRGGPPRSGAGDPPPGPTPEPRVEPAPEPTVEPVPEPSPAPAPEPAGLRPQPRPEPAPSPSARALPEEAALPSTPLVESARQFGRALLAELKGMTRGRMTHMVDRITAQGFTREQAAAALEEASLAFGKTVRFRHPDGSLIVSSVMPGRQVPMFVVRPNGRTLGASGDIVLRGPEIWVENLTVRTP